MDKQETKTLKIEDNSQNQSIDLVKREKRTLILSYVWKLFLLVYTFVVFARVPFAGSYVDAAIDYVLGITKYLFYVSIIFIQISLIFHLPTEKVIKTKKFILLITLIIFSIAFMIQGVIDLIKYPTGAEISFPNSMMKYHVNWVNYFLNWKYSGFFNAEFLSGGIVSILISFAFFFLSYVVLFIFSLIILIISIFAIFNINYRSTKIGLKLRGWMIRKLGGTLKTEKYDELTSIKENQNKVKRISTRLIRKYALTKRLLPFDLLPYTDLSHYSENFKKARNAQEKIAKLFKSKKIDAMPIEVNVYTTYSEVCFEIHKKETINQVLQIQEQISKVTKIDNFNVVLRGHAICIEYTNFYFSKVSLKSASTLFDRKNEFSSFFGLNRKNQLSYQCFKEEPSALIVGNRGSGSTTLSILMILSMCYCSTPSYLSLIILNPYAEASYLNFSKLPHTDGKNYDDINKCNQKLADLVIEMRKRIDLFKNTKVEDIDQHNQNSKEKLKHILVVLSNVSYLLKDSNQNQDIINNLIINGPKLGIFTIMQSYDVTNEIMDEKLYKNVERKYILRLTTENESYKIFDNLRGIQLHSMGDCLTFAKLPRFMERIQLCNINGAELLIDIDIIKTFYETKIERENYDK